MPSDKNQHGQHQGQHQGQHGGQPQYPQQPPYQQPGQHAQQQQHPGQTYDQTGQPTGPSPGGGQPLPNQQQPEHQPGRPQPSPGHRPDQPPGEDRPAHRDTPAERQQSGQDRPPPAPSKEAMDKQKAEQREMSQAASIGAQIILDYNSDAGVAARGGAASTIEENSAIRDANLLALGLNPMAPSGPPTGEPWEPPVMQAAAQPKHVGPSATKMTSLAAGIQEVPTPPPGNGETVGGAAARH